MADSEPGSERLMVVELEGNFVVVSEDDPSDWLACFTPDAQFPARDRAERMAELFNLREGTSAGDPEKPPIFVGTHHPRRDA